MSAHLFMIPIYLLISLSVTHFVTGVFINSVSLINRLPYVTRSSLAHITFNITLESNEILQSIEWTKVGTDGQYKWTPDEAVQSGFFEGKVNSSYPDGDLVFPSVDLKYAGNYTLTINTNMESASTIYKLIVYYSSGDSFLYRTPTKQKAACKWSIEFNIPQMAPYPNITCAFEGNIKKKSVWIPINAMTKVKENITDQGSGIFSYHMKADIPIKDVPLESYLTCCDWIQDTSITYISVKISTVSGTPCPEPTQKANFTYKMVAGEESCHGGYIPFTQMNYSCIDKPDIKPHKTLQCGEQGMWIEVHKSLWPDCGKNTSRPTGSAPSQGSYFYKAKFQLIQISAILLATYCISMYGIK